MSYPLQTAAAVYRILRDELLQRYPELAEDETALLDTLEGLTTIQDQIAALVRSALDDEDSIKGTQQRMQQLIERKVDLQLRVERKRKIAQYYMEECGLKKIQAGDMTLSHRAVAPSVVITDESMIQEQFLRWKSEPDKTAIKAALKDGPVPGAHMSNGGMTLAVKI